MTGAIKEYTKYFDFEIPHFDFPGWHVYYDRNIKTIDSILYLLTGSTALVGAWRNSQHYIEGDVAIDVELGRAYECIVEHTSLAAPNTFAQDRAANPQYWNEISNVRASMYGTSDTAVSISQGLHTFQTQSGKLFLPGTKIIVNSDADPVHNYMWGAVNSYTNGTLVVDVAAVGGVGTYSDWTIMVSGERGATGAPGTPGPIAEAPMTGSVYGRNGAQQQWEVVDAQNADTLTNTPAGNISSISVQGAINELDTEKVAKAGDTMTGALVIDKDGEGLRLNKTALNTYNYLLATAKGLSRWSIVPGNEGIETGIGNIGSDFDIRRYDDTGTFLGIPFTIIRKNGDATFANKLTVQNGISVTGSSNIIDGYLTLTGTMTVATNLQVGKEASIGLYGDGTSLALRGYGGNNIYIQGGAGNNTYATFNIGGLAVTGNGTFSEAVSVTKTLTCGGNAQFSGTKTETNILNAYGPLTTLNTGSFIKSADYVYAASYVQAATAVVAGTYIQSGTYVNAVSSIISSGGLMECRAVVGGNPAIRLENEAQAVQGTLWWDRSSGSVHISNALDHRLSISNQGAVSLGRGFIGRVGVNGATSSSIINFYWGGASKLEAWVDVSLVGIIPSPTELADLRDRLDQAIARIQALEAKLATL